MNLEKIKRILMILFSEDYISNQGPSHITDLIIITIKSLIPSEKDLGVNIDYRRYMEEIKLWKYYRNGQNPSLINILSQVDPYIYWHHKDDTVLPRIIPIILANQDYSITKREIIKNVLFSTGNLETIIEALLIGKLLHSLLLGRKSIIDVLKRELITFSQSEFMANYQGEFRVTTECYSGKFSIDFERYKIQALNILNSSSVQGFGDLQDCIRVYLDNIAGNKIVARCIEMSMAERYTSQINLAKYYNNLGTYVGRLRKGRIDPNALKIKKYDLPDIFESEEGDVFFHSLLNKSTVIKKDKSFSYTIIYLETKLGIYKLTK